ncbi:hypothetical protein WNY37_04075 [Henriciella sp. AS95]|uniref:hypothetical protein n=1 Tax=Henriciella sp. AS95 TaxID=3135782 RepID=UPI0031825B04
MLLSTGLLTGALCLTWTSTNSIELKVFLTFIEIGLFFYFLVYQGAREQAYLRRREAAKKEGLSRPIWRLSEKQLIQRAYKFSGSHGGIKVYSKECSTKRAAQPRVEVVLQIEGDTVAFADIYVIHHEACWYKRSSHHFELDGEELSISSVFETDDVRTLVAEAQAEGAEFITIGLASYIDDAPVESDGRILTRERAARLAEGLIRYARASTAKSRFRAAGLGISTQPTSANSREARLQRSAVVLALKRRMSVEAELSLEEAASVVIQQTNSDRVNLSEYYLSRSAFDQLKERIVDLAGDGAR